MTLSGNSDRSDRAAAARAARQEREATYSAKRPWVFPVIVGFAVVLLVGGVVASSIMGVGL